MSNRRETEGGENEGIQKTRKIEAREEGKGGQKKDDHDNSDHDAESTFPWRRIEQAKRSEEGDFKEGVLFGCLSGSTRVGLWLVSVREETTWYAKSVLNGHAV